MLLHTHKHCWSLQVSLIRRNACGARDESRSKEQAMILPLGAIRRNGRLQHSLSVYESPLRFHGPGDHARDSAGRQSLSCETMAANRWVESETWMGECE